MYFLAADATASFTESLPSIAYKAPPAAVNGLAPPPATAPAPAPTKATPIDSSKFGPCCAKLATNQSIAPPLKYSPSSLLNSLWNG